MGNYDILSSNGDVYVSLATDPTVASMNVFFGTTYGWDPYSQDLDDTSKPADTRMTNGSSSNISISHIPVSSNYMTFCVNVGNKVVTTY